jgi:hypothetical protein
LGLVYFIFIDTQERKIMSDVDNAVINAKLSRVASENIFKKLYNTNMPWTDFTVLLTAFVASKSLDQVYACLRQSEIARLQSIRHWLNTPCFFEHDLRSEDGFLTTQRMAIAVYECIDPSSAAVFELMELSVPSSLQELTALN